MGNANSKAPEENKGSDVPLPDIGDLQCQGSQGHNDDGNVHVYNPAIMPIASNVDEDFPISAEGRPGVPRLEQDIDANLTPHPHSDITNFQQPGHVSLDNPSISPPHNVASYPGPSCLTTISAYDLAESSYDNVPSLQNKITRTSLYATSHAESSAMKSSHNDVCHNASGRDGSEFVPACTPTYDSQTTSVVVMNDVEHYSKKHYKECNNNLTDDERERRNARRRADYRKKKDEEAIKLQNGKQNVSRPSLHDITNQDGPSGSMPEFVPTSITASDSRTTSGVMNDVDHYSKNADNQRTNNLTDEKREQRNARRRADYRKKKDEEMIMLQSEHQNVSRPPLGNITNLHRPSASMPDDKELQTKTCRRTACRGAENDGGTTRLQDEMQGVSQLALGNLTNVVQPSLAISDNPTSSSHISFSHDVAQEPASIYAISEFNHDKELPRRQCERERGSNITVEQREQRNAQRRAAYRKKKDEEMSKLQNGKHNVSQPPLGNITNLNCPSGSMPDDKELQKRTRRRTACRSAEKDNGTTRLQDEMQGVSRLALGDIMNVVQPSLSISDNPRDDASEPASCSAIAEFNRDKELARRQRERERGHNMADEQREQRNVQRRAAYRNGTIEGTINLQENNRLQWEQRKEHRSSLTPDDKAESSAKRKAKYASRKHTPCAESITMPCPDLASVKTDFTPSTPIATSVKTTKAASPARGPSGSMPTYTVDDMEAFLSHIMGDDPIPTNLMDDEYYLFGGQGSDVDNMDGEEDAHMSGPESIDIDPFDYVYSNLPDSTHILKHAANYDHCKAKKFESETDGFCCRNGQIELKEPDPIPELMRLWSSTDADSRHF